MPIILQCFLKSLSAIFNQKRVYFHLPFFFYSEVMSYYFIVSFYQVSITDNLSFNVILRESLVYGLIFIFLNSPISMLSTITYIYADDSHILSSEHKHPAGLSDSSHAKVISYFFRHTHSIFFSLPCPISDCHPQAKNLPVLYFFHVLAPCYCFMTSSQWAVPCVLWLCCSSSSYCKAYILVRIVSCIDHFKILFYAKKRKK